MTARYGIGAGTLLGASGHATFVGRRRVMALATATAAAISKRTALAILGLLALSAPAWAGEQVYIWRDPSGVVRFSSIREPEPSAASATESSTEPLAICDASDHASW